MKNYRISICVAVYNVLNEYLLRCLQSIVEQNYNNFEIIIIDDCSTKYTYENEIKYLKDNDIKYVYVKNDKNVGFAKNKDISRKYITGDVIFDVDSDDVLLPGVFKRINELFNEHTDLDFIFTAGANVFYDNCEIEAFWGLHYEILLDFYFEYILFGAFKSEKEIAKGLKFCLIDRSLANYNQNKIIEFLEFFMFNTMTPWARIYSAKKYKYSFDVTNNEYLKNWEIGVPFEATFKAEKIILINESFYKYRAQSACSTIMSSQLNHNKEIMESIEVEKMNIFKKCIDKLDINNVNFNMIYFTYLYYSFCDGPFRSILLSKIKSWLKNNPKYFDEKKLNKKIYWISKIRNHIWRNILLKTYIFIFKKIW